MHPSSNVDRRVEVTAEALPLRHLSELSDVAGCIPGWQPGKGVLLENVAYGIIRHRVVGAEDGIENFTRTTLQCHDLLSCGCIPDAGGFVDAGSDQ